MPVSHNVGEVYPSISSLKKRTDWITRHEPLFLLVALPPLWLPSAVPFLVPLSFALLILLVVCRRITHGRLVPHTPMDWSVLLILLMLPIGLWASANRARSWVILCRTVLGISLFYGLVGNLRDGRRAAQLVCLLVIAGVGVSLLGLVASDWRADKLPFLVPIYEYLPSISLPTLIAGQSDSQEGLFHPNMIAGTLVVLIPLNIALLGWTTIHPTRSVDDEGHQPPGQGGAVHGWVRKGALAALSLGLVLMLATLLLTQSRLGLLAVALGLLSWATAARPSLRWVPLLGVVGLALLVRDLSIGGQTSLTSRLPQAGTWYARPHLWRAGLEALRDYPFTGMGLGEFDPVARANYVVAVSPFWYFGHSHNLLLQAGVDFGLLGLLGFTSLIVLGAWVGWKTWIGSCGKERWLAGGVLFALPGYIVFGVANCIPLGSKPGFLLWPILALPISLSWQRQLEDAKAPRNSASYRLKLLVGATAVLATMAIASYLITPYALHNNLAAVWLDRAQETEGLDAAARERALDTSIHHLERALANRDTQIVRRRLGLAYLQSGEQARGISQLRQDEAALPLLISRGQVDEAHGRMEQAIEQYTHARALDTASSDPLYYQGEAYRRMGEYDRALEAFSQAIALDNFSTPEASLSESYYSVGRIRLYYSQPSARDEALAAFEAAIQADSFVRHEATVHFDAGLAYYSRGGEEDLQRSIEQLDIAVTIRPEYAQARGLWGLVHFKINGDLETAREAIEAAIDLGEQNVYLRLYLGQLYELAGRPETAIEVYERVVELFPDSAWARTQLERTRRSTQ